MCWWFCPGEFEKALLATSGATLSMVTSRLPRSTGSLAIFSGLMGEKKYMNKGGGGVSFCFFTFQEDQEDG